jgi:drug/metabolite transporter (DMT)-like permease
MSAAESSLQKTIAFAALYAWAILGEGMGAVQMAGGLIVLAGIWLARRGS